MRPLVVFNNNNNNNNNNYSTNKDSPYWEHIVVSNNNNNNKKKNNNSKSPRLLIAQYTAPDGLYNAILNVTMPINIAYAQKFQHDYSIYNGIYLQYYWWEKLVHRKVVAVEPSRATYNKIAILEYAIANRHIYDRLLLLDSDAMMYDFTIDIASYFNMSNIMLIAVRVQNDDPVNTWDVNIGVTIWNSHHKLIKRIIQQWKRKCIIRIIRGRDDEDQYPLHKVLENINENNRPIYADNNKLLGYRDGILVRHFIRSDHQTWDVNKELQKRIKFIQNSTIEICNNNNFTIIDYQFCYN